ncbi:radical SAM protein [candidate division KSB1 bacterium]|nr:radical SAM protein [candidate division KSB1 bacterium]
MNNFTSQQNPFLVVSDGYGQVFEIPGLEMVGMSINNRYLPFEEELIPMPHGSLLLELPGRKPVGYDRRRDKYIVLEDYEGMPVIAAAAFLAPAYTQLYRAAYVTHDDAVTLPLFAYTPVGWRQDEFWVCAVRVDEDVRQDLALFDAKQIESGARQTLQKYAGNRLIEHLVENCVRRYFCPAAQNFVLGRWECPVPVSPSCNASCIGCISKQPADAVPVTQDRLTFIPTVDEILQFTVPHLEQAQRAVISFGQGCEGEPLLQGELIEEAIRQIRKKTGRGTINLNSNASYPHIIERLCKAGLDSIRVSLNSAREELYEAYYRPHNYTFADVVESIKVARKYHKWISLNYFIFPGLTDNPEEMEALTKLVLDHKIDYIQMRNLNIDPEWYINELNLADRPHHAVGILKWQAQLKAKAPWLRFGYFNPPKEEWDG